MPSAQYRTVYTDRELLDAVGDILIHLAQTDQGPVTHGRFNAARAAAGHPHLPTADRIVRRLGASLEHIIDRARQGADPTQWLGARNRDRTPISDLDTAEAAHSLRVAAAFWKAETLTPSDYRQARHELLRADRRRQHGGWVVLLTDDQILAAYHHWELALKAAGLTPHTEQTTGADAIKGGSRRGVPVAEAIDRAITYHGALPTLIALDRFAAAHNFALSRRDAPWLTLVRRARRARKERGVWTPPRALSHKHSPDFAEIIPESEALADWKNLADTHERRPNRFWTKEDCINAALLFLTRELGRKLTQRSYADWLPNQPEHLPQPSAFQRHGGFTSVTVQARRRRVRS